MRASVVVLLWAASACSNGWKSNGAEAKLACEKVYREANYIAAGSHPTSHDDFVTTCVAAMAPTVEPCREYKYGSDSALDCLARRSGPVLLQQNQLLIEAFSKAFVDAKFKLDELDEQQRAEWCRRAVGPAKVACERKTKELAEPDEHGEEGSDLPENGKKLAAPAANGHGVYGMLKSMDGAQPAATFGRDDAGKQVLSDHDDAQKTAEIDPRAASRIGVSDGSPVSATATSDIGTVTPGSLRAQGALDRELIRRIVKKHMNEVQSCYTQELTRHSDTSGEVSLKFMIAGTGQVATSAVESSSVSSPALEQCVAGAVRSWEFPKPQGGGIVMVTYPFVFHVRGG